MHQETDVSEEEKVSNTAENNKKERDLGFWIRFRSSCIIMTVTVLAMVFGGYVLFGFLLIVSMIGLMELLRTVGINKSAAGVFAYLAGAGVFALALLEQILSKPLSEYYILLAAAYLLLLLGVYVLTFPKFNSEQITMAFMGIFYVCLMMSYIYKVRMLDGGAYIVWLIFIGAWGSDTCAYLVGRKLGKHKLAPVLSPKKSVEGLFGGIFGAALIGFIYATIFRSELTMIPVPQLLFAVIGGVSSVISQIGDMAASAIKRNKEIKDYGKLIPGHGGIMDRVDSLIFIAPIVYYFIVFAVK